MNMINDSTIATLPTRRSTGADRPGAPPQTFRVGGATLTRTV